MVNIVNSREGRIVLVTPYDPKTSFNVGNAMARNKLVYCLSDWAIVIATSYNQGGTWAGATENSDTNGFHFLLEKKPMSLMEIYY